MSNSGLVQYVKYSPNNSGERLYKISRITPHCVVGQCTIEALGELFAKPSRRASSNYGIDKNGKVGLFVDEKNRSWCSSNGDNDNRAITIECASDTFEPYKMNDAVYNKLIELCVDICKRNGKKKLLWFNSKETSLNYKVKDDEMILTVHKWYANTMCPGNWLYSRLGDLSQKVTAKLGENSVSNVVKSNKKQLFEQALKNKGDGRYRYYDGSANSRGCSAYVLECLRDAGIITEEEFFHAGTGNEGVLLDKDRFECLPWDPSVLKPLDILWSHGHHVAVWDGKKGVYEAAPERTHGICDNGRTGVGHWSNHGYYNCGTGGNSWSCIYRIKDGETNTEKEDIKEEEKTDICPYLVKVNIDNLRIRKGPGTNYGFVKYCPIGIYTIIEERNGQGASKWGKLKSGIGWLALDYTKFLCRV